MAKEISSSNSSTYINIENLDSTLNIYYPEIKKAFIDLCNIFADVKSNTDSSVVTLDTVNDLLKNAIRNFNDNFDAEYRNIDSSIVSISKNSELQNASLKPLDTFEDLTNKTNDICDTLAISTVTITTCINYCTQKLIDYDRGDITIKELTDINMMTSDDWIDGASGAFADALNEIDNPSAAGAGFLLSCFASRHKDGADLAGFGAQMFITKLDEVLPMTESKFWINMGVGTCAFVIFSAFENFASDEGIMTSEDVMRYLGYTTADTIAFAGSAAVSWGLGTLGGWAGAKIGGSVGSFFGPAGAFIGAVAGAFIVEPIADLFRTGIDYLVGDDILETFELNGVTYEVPSNGHGKNGTWDVIVDRAERQIFHERWANDAQMYSDWKFYLYSNLRGDIEKGTNQAVTVYGVEKLDEIFEEIYKRSIEQHRRADKVWGEVFAEVLQEDYGLAVQASILYNDYLCLNCDFDINQYIIQQHLMRTGEYLAWLDG